MTSFRSALSAAAVGLLWVAGGCGLRPHRTLMHYGFVEVHARGPEIDVTCRADAYYWHAGLLNPNASGFYIHYGRAMDDPRGYTSAEPDPWCGVILLSSRPLRAGSTLRTGSPDPETRLELAGLIDTPKPYKYFAEQAVVHVDEANRHRVRGRFHLTLKRFLKEGDGPPVEVTGRFEVHRKPPPT